MTRLIDADALIEDLEYDVELDTRALDDADLLLGMNRELVQFDKDCKENAIHLLKDAPTVDAVPVSYIQQRIDRLRLLAEYEAEASGGYIGQVGIEVYALKRLINCWKGDQSELPTDSAIITTRWK